MSWWGWLIVIGVVLAFAWSCVERAAAYTFNRTDRGGDPTAPDPTAPGNA